MQITKKSIDILLSKTLKNETNEDLYFYPPPTVGGLRRASEEHEARG